MQQKPFNIPDFDAKVLVPCADLPMANKPGHILIAERTLHYCCLIFPPDFLTSPFIGTYFL